MLEMHTETHVTIESLRSHSQSWNIVLGIVHVHAHTIKHQKAPQVVQARIPNQVCPLYEWHMNARGYSLKSVSGSIEKLGADQCLPVYSRTKVPIYADSEKCIVITCMCSASELSHVARNTDPSISTYMYTNKENYVRVDVRVFFSFLLFFFSFCRAR